MTDKPVNLLSLGKSGLFLFLLVVFPEADAVWCLDGGGVRGITELRILQIIMDRLKARLGLPHDADDPLPCEYFDLIGGTSTGGLIAIMLGRLRMTAVEAADQYNDLAKKIFGPQNKKRWVQDGAFKATTLKEAVEELVATRARAYNTGTSMIPTGNGVALDTKWQVC